MEKPKEKRPTIGTENYKMKDCPFHLPKENLNSFEMLRRANHPAYEKSAPEYCNQLK